jgi:hypothetical protein
MMSPKIMINRYCQAWWKEMFLKNVLLLVRLIPSN